ncbi:hypothetical protein EVAR_82375_1 [Eumeta japonica]|uniref:Uncharacterized protein n=1 Tax=Eumeta variegata TaxID=151549 RepID=A0A4C1UAT9_EUMVA|nr:hypothetical protein EVAR_82375_1 [Eumeta japonica]
MLRRLRRILQESNDTSMSDVNTDELCQNDEDDDAEDAGDMCIVCGEFGRDRKYGTGALLVGFGLMPTALGGTLLRIMGIRGMTAGGAGDESVTSPERAPTEVLRNSRHRHSTTPTAFDAFPHTYVTANVKRLLLRL